MCFPTWSVRPFSPACWDPGARYRIRPTGRYVPGGAYEDGTLIWRQRWVTDNGVIECRQALAFPGVRIAPSFSDDVSALEGDAHLSACVALAGNYGRRPSEPWRRRHLR